MSNDEQTAPGSARWWRAPKPLSARALAIVLAIPGVCRAERPRIAVAHHGEAKAATRRLLAEVRNAGLDPVDVGAERTTGAVSEVADRYGAIAVLSLRKRGRIDVAVVSPETGQVVYESTLTSKGGTPASVRAAEELHGRLIEQSRGERPKGMRGSTAPGEIPVDSGDPKESAPRAEPNEASQAAASDQDAKGTLPPEPPDDFGEDAPKDTGASGPRSKRPSLPELWVGASGGVASGVGDGLNRVPVAKLEARFAPWSRWSASALALLPLDAERLDGPEGTAEVHARIFGAMAHPPSLELGKVLELHGGLGAGAALVAMSGHTSSPGLAGRESTAITGVGLAAIGLRARILPWLSVLADATGGLALYRPVVRFEGRDVGRWGPASLAVTGGLEINAIGLGQRAAP